jgi:hypothetical protein
MSASGRRQAQVLKRLTNTPAYLAGVSRVRRAEPVRQSGPVLFA